MCSVWMELGRTEVVRIYSVHLGLYDPRGESMCAERVARLKAVLVRYIVSVGVLVGSRSGVGLESYGSVCVSMR